MKKLIGAVLVCALVVLFVTTGLGALAAGGTASSGGTASRNEGGSLVSVTENYAKADSTASSEQADSAEASSQSSIAQVAPSDTPSTGDTPVYMVLFALGLILFCSAGLVVLHRI